MFVVDIVYKRLKELDRTLTESRFCRDYLETSRSYLSRRRYSNADASDSVLLRLWKTLDDTAKAWDEIARTSKTGIPRQRAATFRRLADDVFAELSERAAA